MHFQEVVEQINKDTRNSLAHIAVKQNLRASELLLYQQRAPTVYPQTYEYKGLLVHL